MASMQPPVGTMPSEGIMGDGRDNGASVVRGSQRYGQCRERGQHSVNREGRTKNLTLRGELNRLERAYGERCEQFELQLSITTF